MRTRIKKEIFQNANYNYFIYRPLRGASAVVIGAGPAHAFYFSFYEFTKEALAKLKINDNLNYSKVQHLFIV